MLIYETETGVVELGFAVARQEATDTVRTWEVAGTAHADAHLLQDVYGLGPGADAAGILNCAAPVNDGPQHETLMAAFHHLVAWARDGTLPPAAPRLELTGDGTTIARDADGNAIGGVRTPPVDVPVAALSGEPVEGGGDFCFLFGSTTPFPPDVLAERYGSVEEYLAQFQASATEAVDAGFVLPADATAMVRDAAETAPALFG